MYSVELALVIIFGLCIGSFLNVCIYRIPRKLSVMKPVWSFCPPCNKQLTTLENIPVFAWLFQKGRCKCGKERISVVYPAVELLGCFFAVLTYYEFGGINLTSLLVYLLCVTLVVITFIDLEFKIIPNRITYPGIIFGLVIGGIAQYDPFLFDFPITTGLVDSGIGLLIGGGFFYAISYIYYLWKNKVGLGGGDIKMMAMTGALLGWQSIFPTIFIGSLLGSVIGITFMFVKKGDRYTEIPFGPWLALGNLLYIFVMKDTTMNPFAIQQY